MTRQQVDVSQRTTIGGSSPPFVNILPKPNLHISKIRLGQIKTVIMVGKKIYHNVENSPKVREGRWAGQRFDFYSNEKREIKV